MILQFRQQTISLRHSGSTEQYQVEIIQAPGRGWGGPMLGAGIDATHLQTVRKTYRGFLARQQTGDSKAGQWTLHPLRLLGNKLFQALPQTVQARLQEAQAIAQEQTFNLTITLIFEPSALTLVDLPWELLHDPNGRFFYALRGGGIVRCLLLPTAVPLAAAYYPQQIVGLWAEPAGVESLAVRSKTGPAPNKGGPVTWLTGRDSLARLKDVLDENDFDGLHITAHGRTGSATDFALALEDENGRPHWFGPAQLALLLSDYPALRFVYLDVCGAGENQKPASYPEQLYVSPGGAATQLLGGGVTAVVVMQDNIAQAAAGLLAAAFYQHIDRGVPIAIALTQARRSVQLQLNDAIHWSVPAVYIQQQPAPDETAPAADWILDQIAKPGIGKVLLILWIMALLIGRISFVLARFTFETITDQPLLFSAAIVSSSLIPILAAVVTHQGQNKLATTYDLAGNEWRAFLLHKYFSAFTWNMLAWFMIAGVWLTLDWSGLAANLNQLGRQLVWAGGLWSLALAAHSGARQAIRQDLLFRRVGFVLLRGTFINLLLLIFILVVVPLLIIWLLVTILLL